MAPTTRHLADEVVTYVDTWANAHEAESEFSDEVASMLEAL